VSRPTCEQLLDLLTSERTPVGDVWRELACFRGQLQVLIAQHYDELTREGLRLYTATTSQASALRLHIEVNGRRYSHISYQPVEDAQPIGVERSDPRVDEFLRECGL
jgi:hypothetical protein